MKFFLVRNEILKITVKGSVVFSYLFRLVFVTLLLPYSQIHTYTILNNLCGLQLISLWDFCLRIPVSKGLTNSFTYTTGRCIKCLHFHLYSDILLVFQI